MYHMIPFYITARCNFRQWVLTENVGSADSRGCDNEVDLDQTYYYGSKNCFTLYIAFVLQFVGEFK